MLMQSDDLFFMPFTAPLLSSTIGLSAKTYILGLDFGFYVSMWSGDFSNVRTIFFPADFSLSGFKIRSVLLCS